MDIFNTNPGRVAAIDSPGIPMDLIVDDWDGFSGFKAILTGVEMQAQCGVQFLHTLRDFIYIYVFGDRISKLRLSGISFWDKCGDPDLDFHGIEHAYQWYLDHRVSQIADPVLVVLGFSTVFFGFVTGFTIDFKDTESLTAGFTIDMSVLPEETTFEFGVVSETGFEEEEEEEEEGP